MTARRPFADYRARLAELGFRPSRRRGQNFLLDPDIHRVIAEAADLGPADVVLEVGVGLGFLTRELAARAGGVLGVEVDARLLQIVRSELGEYPDAGRHVTLLEGDVLDGSELAGAVNSAVQAALETSDGQFAVVSNVPYSIAGPLMAALMGLPRLPDRIVVLVPRELAQRWTAAPGGREYGALSALLQIAYRPKILRGVGRESFRPRPKVDSAILRLELAPQAVPMASERCGFRGFLRALFRTRRKKLATGLPQACRAVRLPIAEPGAEIRDLRPEALAPQQLWALYRRCASFS